MWLIWFALGTPYLCLLRVNYRRKGVRSNYLYAATETLVLITEWLIPSQRHCLDPDNFLGFLLLFICLFGLPTLVHDTSLEDSLFSSSQQLLITNSFLVEDDILCPLIISLLGFLHILKL